MLDLSDAVRPGVLRSVVQPVVRLADDQVVGYEALLRSLLGDPDFPTLMAEAERVPPGADGLLVLPYLAGERTPVYDPEARGLLAGLGISWPSLWSAGR